MLRSLTVLVGVVVVAWGFPTARPVGVSRVQPLSPTAGTCGVKLQAAETASETVEEDPVEDEANELRVTITELEVKLRNKRLDLSRAKDAIKACLRGVRFSSSFLRVGSSSAAQTPLARLSVLLRRKKWQWDVSASGVCLTTGAQKRIPCLRLDRARARAGKFFTPSHKNRARV